MSLPRRLLLTTALLLPVFAAPARAEFVISAYSGIQDAPHSRVTGNDPGGVGPFSYLFDWDGKSGAMPPYYGFRATWWRTERFGWGVEFNHAKVYATDATLAATGFTSFELTDGLNFLTVNGFYRWPNDGRWTPYVGAGAGIAVPHVDIESAGGTTFQYQFTGPVIQLVAGVDYEINDRWSVFGEYKGTYSTHDGTLENGGTWDTDIVTNALNLGVSFRF